MSPSNRATGWVRRHKVISTLVALLVLGWVTGATGDDRNADGSSVSGATGSDHSNDEVDIEPLENENPAAESAEDSGEKKAINPASARKQRAKQATTRPSRNLNTKAKRAPKQRTYLVTRVIDGDTIELSTGSDVRIVGIDTPEVGQCGYEAATNHMARLVLNQRVRLTMSDEDTDYYGRWLRYVNVGSVDAGLQQIMHGFAIARYDSRDGYGFHVRETSYIAADRASKKPPCPKPAPAPPSRPQRRRGMCSWVQPVRPPGTT